MANAAQDFFGGFMQDVVGMVSVALLVLLVYVASQRLERTRGKNATYHIIYGAAVVVSFVLLPMVAKETLFTPLSVVVAGTIYPIYESLRAVCTIESTDDTVWLSYWITQAVVSFTTEWVDGIGNSVQIHWNMFEFFFFLWLLLPWTDGATLIFDYFFGPIIAPIVQPIAKKMDGVINKLVMAVMNAAHLSVVWIAFVFLPQGLKRVIWIMIATVFPLLSSIVSVTTPEGGDDTYWLTYWSCFGVLFLIADFTENFLGFIPGFYTIVIALTVYLMLPLFRGAEVFFRSVLVPLAGLQEMLVRRDAEVLKLAALAEVPPERRQLVMKAIADTFEKGAKETGNKEGYQSIGDDGVNMIV
jgi:hypothetical protein